MQKLIGWVLMFLGLYFLGKNIYFASGYSRYFWRGVSAKGSILPHTKGLKPLPKGVNLDVEYIQLKLLKEPQEDAK